MREVLYVKGNAAVSLAHALRMLRRSHGTVWPDRPKVRRRTALHWLDPFLRGLAACCRCQMFQQTDDPGHEAPGRCGGQP